MTVVGCAAAPDQVEDEPVGASEQAVVSTNRLSMNRLSMNRLSMNGLSMSRLAIDGRHLGDTELLKDEAGRELLRYIVRCALRDDQWLVGTVDSVDYIFDGLIGLTPDWRDKPLKQDKQRWISACLLAHVNGYGIEVPISLRGHKPELGSDTNERTSYAREEVTFFGNVFAPVTKTDDLGDVGLRMYSCGGAGFQSACSGGTFEPMRTCAGSVDCPLEFLGPCLDVCEHLTSEGFENCHTEPRDAAGHWPAGANYKEAITVYLREVEFDYLYPTCVAPAE